MDNLDFVQKIENHGFHWYLGVTTTSGLQNHGATSPFNQLK